MPAKSLSVAAGPIDTLPFELVLGATRLRRRVFGEMLQWVPVQGEHEIDIFDLCRPHYVIIYDDAVCGAVRLLPMQGPTMIGRVFPELVARSIEYGPDDWELSRFVVDHPICAQKSVRGSSRSIPIAMKLIRETTMYAMSIHAKRVFAVSDVDMERFLISLGFDINRLGAPVDINGISSVAGYIDLASSVADKAA